MTAKPLLSDDERVVMLQKSISDGSRDLDNITSLVGKVIESGAWSSFTDQLGQPVQHDSFRSFVETPRWRGLGTSKAALVGWVKAQDESAADAVERAWRGEIPAARKVGPPPSNERGTFIDRHNHEADGILARLKRDDPALAEQVVAGEVSPNAAALMKGWRKPRIVATSPQSVARRLRAIWTPEQIHELITSLTEEEA